MKSDILVFAAHPDDAELACSGTILAHIAMGKKVVIVDLTRGELGTRGTPKIREEEAQLSSSILGVHGRENLGFRDGFFVNDEKHQLEIIRMIRKYQPQIVLANAEIDRHIDHGRASILVHDACFLSGLIKIETKHEEQIQAAWRPERVYHYVQDWIAEPDIVVDITPYFETKMKSIRAFKSQFYDPNSTEPETPIASEDFLSVVEGRCLEYGRRIGVKYAEGFTVKGSLGTRNLFHLL